MLPLAPNRSACSITTSAWNVLRIAARPSLFVCLTGRARGSRVTAAGLRSVFRHHRLMVRHTGISIGECVDRSLSRRFTPWAVSIRLNVSDSAISTKPCSGWSGTVRISHWNRGSLKGDRGLESALNGKQLLEPELKFRQQTSHAPGSPVTVSLRYLESKLQVLRWKRKRVSQGYARIRTFGFQGSSSFLTSAEGILLDST